MPRMSTTLTRPETSRIEPGEVARPTVGRRLAGIEGLRGIAAASVLITHVWNQSQTEDRAFQLGFASDYILPTFHHGVILFFALSGFLLWLPFAAALLNGRRPPSIRAYARNRFLRIAPAYWVILLIASFVLWSVRNGDGERGTGALTDPKLLVENLLLIQNYDGDGTGTGIGAAWSLSVELVFYALLPMFAVLAFRALRSYPTRGRMRLYLLAPGLLLGMVGLAASWFGPRKDSDVSWLRQWETGFFTHAHLFALGMLLAVLLADVQDGRVRLPRGWRPMTIATLIVCGLGTVWLADGQRVPERIEVCLVAVCCALLLASTVLGDPRTSRLVRVLDSRPLIWAGLVSYSVYLWHMPVIDWMRARGLTGDETGLAFVWNLLLVATVTAALSYLTYRFVEKPALARKKASRSSESARVSVPVRSP